MRAWRASVLALVLLGATVAATRGTVHADEATRAAREDQVLVLPKAGASLSTLLGTLGADDLGAVGDTSWHTVSVPLSTTASGLVASLAASTTVVEDAQLDYAYAPTGSTLPAGSDELASAIPDQDELLRVSADTARTRATGDGVRVAVIDSGILASLAGVSGQVDDGYDAIANDDDPTEETDGIDNDGDGDVDEMHGHGTFVASLVLAVAPDARIVPVRAIDADGMTSSSLLATAIAHALDLGVDLIDLSVAVDAHDTVLRQAVYSALTHGVLVVSAAGNDARDIGATPSAIADMVVTTAVGSDDVLADFASYGSGVDVSAPGVDLLGAYPSTSGTAVWSGTSFSTALVAGALALERELHPTYGDGDLVDRILSTSDSIDSVNASTFAGKLGAGRIDLDAATGD